MSYRVRKLKPPPRVPNSGSNTSSSERPPGKPNFTRRFPRFVIDVRLQVKMFQAGEFRQLLGPLHGNGSGWHRRYADRQPRTRRDRDLGNSSAR